MPKAKISGVFINPDGAPVPDVILDVTAITNNLSSFRQRSVKVKTDATGNYAFELYEGNYRVRATYPDEGRTDILGDLQLEESSPPGTLNDYLVFADPSLSSPTLYAEMKRIGSQAAEGGRDAKKAATLAAEAAKGVQQNTVMVESLTGEAAGAAQAALQSEAGAENERRMALAAKERAEAASLAAEAERLAAEAARDAAQLAGAGVGLMSDIDTGLAQTKPGEGFSVAQGMGADAAVNIYRNENGKAVLIGSIPGTARVDSIAETVRQQPNIKPYLATADQHGRIGAGFTAFHEDGSFGTKRARLSNNGLMTPVGTITAAGLDLIGVGLKSTHGPNAYADNFGRLKLMEKQDKNQYEVPAIGESAAIELWLPGGKCWEKGCNSGAILKGVSAVTTRANNVSVKPIAGGLIAPFTDRNVYTLAFCVQLPFLPDETQSSMLYTFTDSAANPGIRCWFRRRADDGLLTLCAARSDKSSPLIGILIPAHLQPGDFVVVAHAIHYQPGNNWQVLWLYGQPPQQLREFQQVIKTNSPRSLAIGNAYYNSDSWKTTDTTVAEIAIFEAALSGSQLVDYGARCNLRQRARGLNIAR